MSLVQPLLAKLSWNKNFHQTDLDNKHSKDSTAAQGATLVEYMLLIMLIAVVAIAALQAVGNQISDQYSFIGSSLVDAFED